MYQIWLRSFTPEGTLGAAAKRLPDVAELGATIVYLPPIMLQDDDPRREFWSPRQRAFGINEPRNPYRIKDYSRIDPEYGTEADLHEFITTAHRLGLHVLLDLVYPQTGPTCVLMKNPDFYQRDTAGKVVITGYHFSRLNYGSNQLREYLWANMAHWVKDFKVDGFRCDTSDEVPLDFWEEARTRLDPVRPDLAFLAEGYKPTNQVKAFDIEYDRRWYRLCTTVVADGESATALRGAWEQRHDTFPRGARFIHFCDDHDQHRAAVVFGERGAIALSVVNFTLDGVPFLYNGQEIDDATPLNLFAHWPIRWEARCLPQAVIKREFYHKLCQLRRMEPALTEGEVVWLANDQPDSVVSLLRRAGKEEIVTVANLTNRKLTVQVELPGGHPATYDPLLPKLTFGGAGMGTKLEELKSVSTAPGTGKLAFDLGGFCYFVGKRQSD